MLVSHLSHHPRIGYTYTPGFRGRIPHESGGYLVRVNAAGFRSEREFVAERAPGKRRALVFGDSQTAGLGVNNRQRYSDLLETLVPDLEVYNYGLDNTGTDQQYLAYQEFGGVEHDLVVIGLYVEDLPRVNAASLRFKDAKGQPVLYAKPYYAWDGDALVLRQVPVPKRPLPRDAAVEPPAIRGTYARARALFHDVIPPGIRQTLKARGLTDAVQRILRLQRAPGYDAARGPAWRLLAGILKMWIARSASPILLCPIPMWTFVDRSSDPTAYRARFRELAASTGCVLHDPFDDMLAERATDRRALYFDGDKHLSPRGHEVLARSIAPAVRRMVGPPASDMRSLASGSGEAIGAGA